MRKNKKMRGIIIDILDLFSWGKFKEIWRWTELDGFDICKSDWLPKGYSPSDLITNRKYKYLKDLLAPKREEEA